MKLKNEMIFLCLILFMLISISAVASADNNTIIISENNNVDDNILSINDLNNEIRSETGDGSFAELNNTINGGTSNSINLTNDYAYSSSDTIKEGIIINTDNFVIDGQGHTIDAKGQSRIFFVNSTTVTLKNINFINGNSEKGGAIYGNGDNLRVINCTFINNSAQMGGAVYSYPYSYSVFAKSTFIDNTAEKGGGAIATIYGIRHDVLYCNFISNHASETGGALYILGELGTTGRPYDDYVNLIGDYFIGNKAPEGSAIANVICAIINLTDSVILGDDYETLVYSWGRMFTADNNWWGSTVDNKSVKPNITSEIDLNTWLYFDLAIDLGSSSATVSINNLYNGKTGETSTYATTKLPSIGVEFTAINATLSSDNISLDHSGIATINYNVLGDCTITANCQGRVVSKKFKSGSFAELQGLVDNSDDILVLDKDYVYTIGIDKLSSGIRIEKSNFILDGDGYIINAGNKSRVIDIYGRNVTLKNVVISGGNVYDIAGAGVKSVGANIKFINCTFINNHADDGSGGSAIFVGSRGTLISECRFINNSQTYTSGGAVYCGESNVTIINSVFEDNYAVSRGGAVYVTQESTTITNCTFRHNTASEGGAIYDYTFGDYPLVISDCSFIDNVATAQNSASGGGAICARNSEITNSLFKGNTALMGAAIFSTYSANNIEKCLFVNNTGAWNGIIFFTEGSSVVDSIFLNNNLKGGNIIVSLYGGARADYNWYGNVWKNYNKMPDVSNLAEMNNWLFLNLTNIVYNDADETLSGEFNFFVYDNDNDYIDRYDFNNLWLFDLSLSSQNLTLNKNTVALGETFNATVDYYKGNLIAQYENVVYEMPFKFQKETWFEVNPVINVVITKTNYTNELLHPFEYDYMPFLISAQRIRYEVANSSIAKVDTKGKITGLKVGVTNLTIRFTGYDVMGRDMYKPCNVTVAVNVTRIPTKITAIYDVPEIVYVGLREQIILSVDPSGSLTYTCNDTSVADVGYGFIYGLKEGVVNVTASFPGNDKYAPSSLSFITKVSKRISTIEITPSGNITIDNGDTYYIGVSSYPSGVELNYTSSNPNVAIFDGNKVIGVGGGLANITVSFAGNDKYLPTSAQLLVKVLDYKTYFDVNSTVYVNVTDYKLLNAILKNDDGNKVSIPFGHINYTSNDTSVVEVDSNGAIFGIGQGKASITIVFSGYGKYLPSNATVTVISSVVPTMINVESEIELHVDDLANINATLNYGNSRELKYSSNDTSVVGVNRYGDLIAHKVGIAEITINYPGTKKFVNSSAHVIVNVTRVPTKIEVGSTFALLVNDNESINASLNPESAGNLTYLSSDENIITIDTNGTVTALSQGNATITISFAGDEKYASSNETVIISIYKDEIPTSIEVNGTITLYAGNKTDIGAVLTPSNGGILNYTSNDTSVVTIDENGIITAVGEGSALISIKLEKASPKLQDNAASVIVKVLLVPTKIEASESININLTENITLDYAFSHPEAGNVEFVIANPNIISIENGVVIGKAVGNTTITINFNGNRQYSSSNATAKVNVVDVGVSINVVDVISVNLTESADIGAELIPSEAGNLVYVSSDESIVSVDKNGVITANKVGEADIVVKFEGNGKYRANSTTVHIKVVDVGVRIDVVDVISVNVTETAAIGAELIPSEAGNLVYVSSDESIVSVDKNGVITANKVGEADIVVKFEGNGKYRANSTTVHIKVVDVKTDIEIENVSISLIIDESVNINATLIPNVGELNYVSSNSSVVKVDKNGQITALKAGTAVITVSYEGKGKYVASSKNITVNVSKIPTEIIISKNITMQKAQYLRLNPNLRPFSISGVLNYSSSNIDVVEIDQDGYMASVNSGKANITITFAGNDKYMPCEAIVEVTVSAIATFIEVNDTITIGYGESMQLGAVLKTTYYTFSDILLYESSNPEIVSIDENGVIKANKQGQATITIKYEGKSTSSGVLYKPCNATVNVFVTAQTTKITVKSNKISLKVDGTADIVATLDRPENGVLTYRSSNEAIATVDANGKVVAIGEGNAIITITYAGNEDYHTSSANVTVSVSRYATNIKSNLSYYLKVDDIVDLGAITTPNDGKLTYSSSNEAIVTVDEDGKVTGLKSGSAIITIKFDGDRKYLAKEKKVNVFVSRIATVINIDPIELYIGEEYQIENVLTPAGAGELTYESFDWDIFDVDSDGLITTTNQDGSADLLVSFEGNYKYEPSNATVLVTVNKRVIPSEDYKFDVSVRDELGRATFSIKLPNNFNGNFVITVDGEDTYSAPVVNGVAKYTVDDLKVGKHKVRMSYSGNALYAGIIENKQFSIASVKIDKNKDINVVYTATAKYSVHLTKNTQAMPGKKVTFLVNGKKLYAKTNSKGYATIKVKLPKLKSYKVTAVFGRYKVSNKITVKHVVAAKNVVAKKSAKAVKIKVSLKKVNKKYLSGKKLTLKFNGKKLTAKTNKKGVATFTLKKNLYGKLKVGKKYTYKVTYLKDTVGKKITIKK